MLKTTAKIALALICMVIAVSATPQIPDILIHEGKEYPIFNVPLAEYFKKYPDRNPKVEEEVCSGLWRGYRAIFEISNGELLLKDVLTNVCFGKPTSKLSKAVPDRKPLSVDWVTGILVSMYGDNPEDPYGLAHLEAFEKYFFFEFDLGRLTVTKHFDNKGYHTFRKSQFEAFKKTDEYKAKAKRMNADGKYTSAEVDQEIAIWLFFSLKKLFYLMALS